MAHYPKPSLPVKEVVIPFNGENYSFFRPEYLIQEKVISSLSDYEMNLLQTITRKEEMKRILKKEEANNVSKSN